MIYSRMIWYIYMIYSRIIWYIYDLFQNDLVDESSTEDECGDDSMDSLGMDGSGEEALDSLGMDDINQV